MSLLSSFFKKTTNSCPNQTTTLSKAKTHAPLKVECLCGEEEICHRLREMGFCESAIIEKVADNGSLICKVCDTKILLNKELAKKIMVSDVCSHATVIPLSQMRPGQSATLKSIASDAAERLLEMGLTPNEKIEIIRFAPLGDPIEIRVRGYLLSLRKADADHILVITH